MKLIFAIVRVHKLESVLRELTARGIVGATIIEVEGYGRQMGHDEVYRGTEYKVVTRPKRGLLVAVREEDLNRAREAIRKGAQTGQVGDGKIFILDLEDVIRIRTGDSGGEAI